jgi:hypothetical protein
VISGTLTAILLFPVPAFAVFTYNWTSITGTDWTATANDNVLTITPPSPSVTTTLTIMGTVTNTDSSNPHSVSGTFNGLGNLKLSDGSLFFSINVNSTSLLNTQFSPSPNHQPDDGAANGAMTPVPVASGATVPITITISPSGSGTQFSKVSSGFTLTFTP